MHGQQNVKHVTCNPPTSFSSFNSSIIILSALLGVTSHVTEIICTFHMGVNVSQY